jgi:hypothetical protein
MLRAFARRARLSPTKGHRGPSPKAVNPLAQLLRAWDCPSPGSKASIGANSTGQPGTPSTASTTLSGQPVSRSVSFNSINTAAAARHMPGGAWQQGQAWSAQQAQLLSQQRDGSGAYSTSCFSGDGTTGQEASEATRMVDPCRSVLSASPGGLPVPGSRLQQLHVGRRLSRLRGSTLAGSADNAPADMESCGGADPSMQPAPLEAARPAMLLVPPPEAEPQLPPVNQPWHQPYQLHAQTSCEAGVVLTSPFSNAAHCGNPSLPMAGGLSAGGSSSPGGPLPGSPGRGKRLASATSHRAQMAALQQQQQVLQAQMEQQMEQQRLQQQGLASPSLNRTAQPYDIQRQQQCQIKQEEQEQQQHQQPYQRLQHQQSSPTAGHYNTSSPSAGEQQAQQQGPWQAGSMPAPRAQPASTGNQMLGSGGQQYQQHQHSTSGMLPRQASSGSYTRQQQHIAAATALGVSRRLSSCELLPSEGQLLAALVRQLSTGDMQIDGDGESSNPQGLPGLAECLLARSTSASISSNSFQDMLERLRSGSCSQLPSDLGLLGSAREHEGAEGPRTRFGSAGGLSQAAGTTAAARKPRPSLGSILEAINGPAGAGAGALLPGPDALLSASVVADTACMLLPMPRRSTGRNLDGDGVGWKVESFFIADEAPQADGGQP